MASSSDSARGSRGIAVAAAVVGALVVVILLVRDRGAEAGARPAVRGETVAADPLPSPSGSPVAVRAASAPSASAAAPRTPLTRAETVARLDSARAMLRSDAKPCWKARAAKRPPPVPGGPALPDETLGVLQFRYALVVHGGEAEVENVEVIESTVSDPELDACLRDAVARAHWPATGPDGMLEVQDRLRIGDLTIPDAPSIPKVR